MTDEQPRVVLPSPEQLRRVAKQLREVTPFQATQPLDRVLSGRMLRTLSNCMAELARMRSAPGREREARLEARVDDLSILATSRRLPLRAIEALVARADEAGAESISVAAIRQALARTEADHDA